LIQIAPFRPLRFNPRRVSFISRVVAPPYDIITKKQAQELRELDDHNVVRLTLQKEGDEPRPPEAYEQAARLLTEWRAQDVLIREPVPCLYLCEQMFWFGHERLTRRGLLCATLLGEPNARSVFRHEKTTTGPKIDRYKLMQACRASLSPVFAIFADAHREAGALMQQLTRGIPVAEFTTDDDVAYRVWRITDRRELQTLAATLRDKTLVIADGHHRYETAVVYRRKNRSVEGAPGSAPEDFLLTFCVPASDPGLCLRPTHRLVNDPRNLDIDALVSALSRYFDADEISVASTEDIKQALSGWEAGDRRFACFAPGGRLVEFSPREEKDVKANSSPEEDWSRLPVNILHRAILPQILNLPEDQQANPERLAYEAEPETLYWDVESGRFNLAFLLPPLSPGGLARLSQTGHLLPPKTTYFHPKIASGLAIYPFEGDQHLPKVLQD